MSRLSRVSSTMRIRRGLAWGAAAISETLAGSGTCGQLDDDRAAEPRPRASHLDSTPVLLGEAPHQRQPDAEAAFRPVEGPLALEEEIEDPLDHVRRHAGAGVRHREPSHGSVAAHRDLDAPAPRRVLDRVREQVHDDLLDPRLIGQDPGGLGPHRDRVMGRLAGRHEARDASLRGLGEVHRHADQVDLAGADAAHVEQIVHQPAELADLPGDDLLRLQPRAGPGSPARRARAPRCRSRRADCAARGRASRGTRPWPGWSPPPPLAPPARARRGPHGPGRPGARW